MKKSIKWEKYQNPLTEVVTEDGFGEGKVMVRATPFGVEGFRANEKFPPERSFVGHTNFDISVEVKEILDDIEGVEVVQIYSSYRMRIIVGKNFNSKKVLRSIEDILCEEEDLVMTDAFKVDLFKEKTRLISTNKPWVMYVLPGGKFESKVFNKEKDMEKCAQQYNQLKARLGGIVFSS